MAANRDQVLAFFREARAHFEADYGVRRIGLFGSVVHDALTPASDLDVVVAMDNPTFDRYMDLKFEIEDRFGMPVDLVLEDGLKERLRPVVAREAVYA